MSERTQSFVLSGRFAHKYHSAFENLLIGRSKTASAKFKLGRPLGVVETTGLPMDPIMAISELDKARYPFFSDFQPVVRNLSYIRVDDLAYE